VSKRLLDMVTGIQYIEHMPKNAFDYSKGNPTWGAYRGGPEEDYNKLVNDYFDSDEDSEMAQKTGIRHKINSDEFEIIPDEKTFKIGFKKLTSVIGLSPWPPQKDTRLGEKDLGEVYPKLSVISSETGKDATFFLHSSLPNYLIFKPSKGTVIHKKLGGWIIEVDRNG
jgi:hypothetical protein